MPLSQKILEKRAVKSGVKASKKRHHLVSETELLALRVQTMPGILRISLALLGTLLLAAAWFGWPSESNTIQGIEAIGGIFSTVFGIFGIRRTLSHLLDSYHSLDLVGGILEMIGEAVSNIDL